jgi:catechol 2,3-dioxygenase-like lactoylglutathione lyase family enzyme
MEGNMLESAPTIAFLATTDAERARGFYEGVLGLRLVTNEPQTLVFDCSGTMLRISEFEGFQPQAFTVLGWVVDDIESTMTRLAERGVEFERYEGLGQNERGIATFAGGAKVGWFRDPDGNGLSLTQFGVEG